MVKKKFHTLVSGSLAYDVIMDFPDTFRNHILPEQLHILNVSFGVSSLRQHFGGTAGNIAFTLKMLGGLPVVIAALGSDGDSYFKHLRAFKIPVSHVKRFKDLRTACAYVTTDKENNQITAFYFGTLAKAPSLSLRSIKEPLSLAIISPTHKDAMLRHLKESVVRKIPVMFDPGQAMTALSAEELRFCIAKAKFVIGNDYEMRLLMDRTGWSEKKILEYVDVMITTLGSEGSRVLTRDGDVKIEACGVAKVVDPTGAGDAYRAGFVAGLSRGFDFVRCARMGSVAASYVVEKFGTQSHRFSHAQFERRYRGRYKERINL